MEGATPFINPLIKKFGHLINLQPFCCAEFRIRCMVCDWIEGLPKDFRLPLKSRSPEKAKTEWYLQTLVPTKTKKYPSQQVFRSP